MPRNPKHSSSLHDARLVAGLNWRGMSVAEAETFLDDFTAVAVEALAAGEELELRSLGTFRVRDYPASTGRIPARRRVVFRASWVLLDALNRRKRRRLGHG